MDDHEITRWVESRQTSDRLSTQWDHFTQFAWRSERQRFTAEMNRITSRQLYQWAMGRDSISETEKTSMREAIEDGGADCEGDLTPYQKGRLEVIESWVTDKGLPSFISTFHSATTNETVKSVFQVNVTKQNVFEKLSCEWIGNRSEVRTVRLAASETKLQLRFRQDGSPVIGGSAKDADCKSVDLLSVGILQGRLHCVIAAHKFARTSGGHQNNQQRDAEAFLACAKRGKEAAVSIPELTELGTQLVGLPQVPTEVSWEPALVLDGGYFTQAIRDISAGERSTDAFVGTSDSFADYLKRRFTQSD